MTGTNKDEKPLVSVVIPTYNRINTLPVSIDSVLGQTYRNLEVVVVDDGSDDGTEEYVRGLADSRVKYIRNAGNRGPSVARNLGVRHARGEYVAFQDSDDEWLPEKLEKQMQLFLDLDRDIGMVYCEYIRYYGKTARGVTPPKDIPYNCKQGQIFKILLLQPLMGMPTIVVKRQAFMDAGGFNELLNTYEDYEFTVRLSQDHTIGFVEDTLVRVYDSPDSVNKKYADRIRTQAYIVREMIAPLRESGLLWEKLSAMQREAEALNCHDAFIEELQGLTELFATDGEKQKAAELLEKTQQSETKKNQIKVMARQELEIVKQQILKTYLGIYRDDPAESGSYAVTLQQAEQSLLDCAGLFQIPSDVQDVCKRTGLAGDADTKAARLSVLTDLAGAVEAAEAWIEGQLYECNACGQRVFQSESGKCPFCKAAPEERLFIAFLEELQPEGGEELDMLEIMPSRLLENYALSRGDIRNEKTYPAPDGGCGLCTAEDERYDVIVCQASPEDVGTVSGFADKLYKILKPGGMGLAVPGASDYTEQLQEAGFYTYEVGENWFGAEFYQGCGFDRQLALLVITKKEWVF